MTLSGSSKRLQWPLAFVLVVAALTTMASAQNKPPTNIAECQLTYACGSSQSFKFDPSNTAFPCRCCDNNPLPGVDPCRNPNYLCPASSKNCRYCDQGGRCLSCITGYTMIGGVCQVCHRRDCEACMKGDGNQCNVCLNGYWWRGESSCQLAPAGTPDVCGVAYCDTCFEAYTTQCWRCSIGYSIQADATCVSLCNVANCQSCYLDSEEECMLCFAGYVPNADGSKCSTSGGPGTNQCRVTHCEQCESGNNGRCQRCNSRYQLDPTDGLCKRCIVPRCIKCADNDVSVCATCAEGYRLTASGGCEPIPCDVENCLFCVANDRNRCRQCRSELYTLTPAGKCELPATAAPPSTNNPTVAPTVPNEPVGPCRVYNCLQCQSGSEVLCKECRSGYGLTTTYLCVKFRSPQGASLPPQSLVVAAFALVASVLFVML